MKNNQPEWIVLRPSVEEISNGGQRYLPQADGSFLALGYAPTKHTAKLYVTNDLQHVTAFRFELLTDPNLPCSGPGRSFKGTCALTEFKVEAMDAKQPTNKVAVKFEQATADSNAPQIGTTPIRPTRPPRLTCPTCPTSPTRPTCPVIAHSTSMWRNARATSPRFR